MNGFGIQQNNIDKIIKSIELQIKSISSDFNKNVTLLNNKLAKSTAELEKVKQLVLSIPDYTNEYETCKQQIEQLNTDIEDIRSRLNTITYCEVED